MFWLLNWAFNGTQEIQNGYKYPNVRIFQTSLNDSYKPTYDLLGIAKNWSIPTNESLPNFSAVCWYFGKYLNEKLNVPIGLMETCWGATNIEKWSSDDALKNCELHRNPSDSSIWNSMVHPLTNTTIYGAIWYQGESNAGKIYLKVSFNTYKTT